MRNLLLSLSVLTILSVFCGVLWLGYDVYTTGFSAKVEPHPIEVAIVRQLRRLAIPSKIRDMPNPVPMSPTVVMESLEHFADHCAICHANNGSGETGIGKNVFPRVPDLRLEKTQSLSDGELFFMIHNGVRFTGMPAWGESEMDKDTDSWKLVHFIRHLRQLTPEELDRMKSLNPKPPHDSGDGDHHH